MSIPTEYFMKSANNETEYIVNTNIETGDMAGNMYRVGDYVYFETSSSSPYQIRRIEELNKTANGNVEAKVMCFFRRRDLPSSLIMLADKHQWLDEGSDSGIVSELNNAQRHRMKHRELFLSRQIETMPATHIRGKCCVTLLNETESLLSYLNKEDTFFYCLVFDPTQRTLLADKGEIRVGSRYQADNIAALCYSSTENSFDLPKLQNLEKLVWTPHHSLSDRQIDQFLVISRSVGTFARALDCTSSVKQPSLHMSAAAASRDITLFHAMDTLHKHNYDIARAMSSLVPCSGPVLCRDEMEEWSASEANLFEEALEKYGKDFSDIRQDFLPWKTVKNIVEYYYMWKTTDRYVQQKRVKAVEAESKLKQVYIPNYSKNSGTLQSINAPNINSNSISAKSTTILNGTSNGNVADLSSFASQSGNNVKPCEGCHCTQSVHWFSWGPSHIQCRLCSSCWYYWKKYGGLQGIGNTEDADVDKKKCNNGSDEENKGNNGSHRHRCSISSCNKEFKLKAHLSRHYASAHGMELKATSSTSLVSSISLSGLSGCSSGSPRPVMKTRSAFYLRTSALTRAARKLCAFQMRARHVARSPHQPLNMGPLRHFCASAQLASKNSSELRLLSRTRHPRIRPRVTDIASKLGNHPAPKHPGEWDWLMLPAPTHHKEPDHVSFPKPPKAPDGSLLYEKVPNRIEADRLGVAQSQLHFSPMNQQVSIKRSRNSFDDTREFNNIPQAKKIHLSQQQISKSARCLEQINIPGSGAPPPLLGTRVENAQKLPQPLSRSNLRKQVISWMDAPDDLFFQASEQTKKLRRSLSLVELRRAARKPWRILSVSAHITSQPKQSLSEDMIVVLD